MVVARPGFSHAKAAGRGLAGSGDVDTIDLTLVNAGPTTVGHIGEITKEKPHEIHSGSRQ
jgi:hypothetical protein